MNPLKVLLVDDHATFRQVVHDFLSKLPQVCVVGEASNGQEAVLRVRELHPDVVIMDVRMPVMNGFAAAKIIKKGWPATRVLMTTTEDSTVYRSLAREADADGFVPKGDLKNGLVSALDTASSRTTRNMTHSS